MADETYSPSPENGGETSSNYTPKSYDIAPEDAELAESIASFDPIYDIAGPVTSDAPIKVPSKFTREMLPADMLESVDARLDELPVQDRTPQREQVFMREALEQNAYALRVKGGPGPEADLYKQEWFLLENEKDDARTELTQLQAKLLDVHSHKKVTGAETGEEMFEPVYILQGDARSAAEHRVSELKQRAAILEGSEGQRRLQRALHEAVAQHKALAEEAAINAEAQDVAKREARAARVAERAAGYRKFEDTER